MSVLRKHPPPPRRPPYLAVAAATLVALAALTTRGEEPTPTPEQAGSPVFHIRVDATIQPVTSEFIIDSLHAADRAGAEALVIELATPGGQMSSLQDIVTAMLGSATPVVVWVAPAGSRAASAGFYILMAADVAAMAPSTHTGAAAVVGPQGQDLPETLRKKAQEDAAALIRSLATRHGRDPKVAEQAVFEAKSFTVEEALEKGLVDLEVPSLTRLLSDIDGRTVEKNGRKVVLATRDAPVRELEMSAGRRFLSWLADPNIAALLFTLGALGLYFELMNPGAVLPGVIGGIAIILAAFGFSLLPVNWAGVALIALAVIFFIAEIKVPSYGLLTVAGVTSLVLGLLMLYKTADPALRVSRSLIAMLAAFSLLLVGFLATLTVRRFRLPVRSGDEGLVRETGRARTALAPRGKVFVHGELWDAVSDAPVAAGEPVQVLAVEGMTLRVRPTGPGSPPSPPTFGGESP